MGWLHFVSALELVRRDQTRQRVSHICDLRLAVDDRYEDVKMKIKTKLRLGFGVQVLFAAILGVSVLFGIHAVERQFSFVVEHDAPVVANRRQSI